ncbi:MAG: MFS transporter [Halobacteriota archaeon]
MPTGRRLPALLANRSFVRLLSGRVVSNAGDSLYYVAAMWLVYAMTGSALFTGVAGFLVRAPSALSFLIGPLVDRWRVRRVLVASQLVNALVVLVVPLAAWTGRLSVWLLLGVLPVVTLVNQFVYPAQNAALPRMVEEAHLARANAWLASAYRGADMVFNALAGVLIAAVGAVSLFVLDSVTFAVALLLYAGLSVPPVSTDREADGDGAFGRYLAELRDGIDTVRRSRLVPLLGGVVLTNLTAGAMLGVLPAYAATRGGAGSFGLLMAAYAGGTLAGMLLAPRIEHVALGRFVAIAFPLGGLAVALALASPSLWLTLAFFLVSFVPVGSFNVLFWTVLQSTVAPGYLGRVSSVAASAGAVAIPVGSTVGGAVATVTSPGLVVLSWGVGLCFFGGYVLLRSPLRSLSAAAHIDAVELGLEA